MSQSWAGGSTTAHRAARANVLTRDRYRCRLKIPGTCTTTATTAHHTIGKAITGDDPRYMIAACLPCNLKVGDPSRTDPAAKVRRQW